MDDWIPVNGSEDLRQVKVEPEVMPDKLRIGTGKGEAVLFLADADQFPAHDSSPCIPFLFPAKNLSAGKGEVKVERLVVCKNKRWHAISIPESL